MRIRLDVSAVGLVNRAYGGYVTPGKIAPLIPWQTETISPLSEEGLLSRSATIPQKCVPKS